MNIVKELLHLIWHNDLNLENNMSFLTLIIYSTVFLIMFLENASVLAIFLPGDSLLIILGVLIARGVLDFCMTLGILTIAASLGSWIGYLQGKFMKKNKIVQNWLSRIPNNYYQTASNMLFKYGISVLFIGRFIVFVRTVLPVIVGASGFNAFQFQVFNWVSSFLWVLVLIVLGLFFERSSFLLSL